MPDGALHAARDQATGLRELFARRPARVTAVIGSAGQGPAAAALALARAACANGERCIVVDATHGEVAHALGRGARYELHHALQGERTLEQVVLATAEPLLRVLPAARALPAFARHPAAGERLASLAQRLSGERIVIAAGERQAEDALRFARGSEVAIACGRGLRARVDVYGLIKRLAAQRRASGFRLLVEGGPAAAEAACELAGVASRFLALPVGLGGDLDDPAHLAATLGDWACAELPFSSRQ